MAASRRTMETKEGILLGRKGFIKNKNKNKEKGAFSVCLAVLGPTFLAGGPHPAESLRVGRQGVRKAVSAPAKGSTCLGLARWAGSGRRG